MNDIFFPDVGNIGLVVLQKYNGRPVYKGNISVACFLQLYIVTRDYTIELSGGQKNERRMVLSLIALREKSVLAMILFFYENQIERGILYVTTRNYQTALWRVG